MSEPTSSSPAPSSAPSVAQNRAGFWAAVRGLRGGHLLAVVVALLCIAVAWLWWRSSADIAYTQRELTRRVAESDARSVAATQTAQDAANRLVDALKQVAVLEAKLEDSQSQQYALEQMYQELSRNRDEIQLADIEQAIAAAAQQLQLTGNVQAALLTLQNADARLARINKAQFLGVRRALARDIDRLKALPSADISGMAVKIDQAVTLIDGMPALIDEKPAPMAAPKPHAGENKAHAPAAEAAPAGNSWWRDLLDRLNRELRGLVRIREVGSPDALLLAPNQAYFARENLKLRLLNARLQLIGRNEAGFRSDLQAGLDWIGRYFEPAAKQTQQVQALLRQLQAVQVSVELPNLSDSLNAVREFKPGSGAFVPALPNASRTAPAATTAPGPRPAATVPVPVGAAPQTPPSAARAPAAQAPAAPAGAPAVPNAKPAH